uniref:Brain tumor protein-like n=1 Tax=Hirondellea gigas TaxID=1518452 RepID=A0A2P2HY96_9CRUS
MSVGSPTPSLESFSGTPIGSLIDSDPTRSLENSPPVSTTSSVTGHTGPVNTICPCCNDTFVQPRTLQCLHAICFGCAEKLCDVNRIQCPTCHQITEQHPSILVPDYALLRLLESALDEPSSCTACKSRDIAAIARCLECTKLLCNNCVMAHEYMHCFQTHRVLTLSELAQRDERPVVCIKHKEPIRFICTTCDVPICQDCSIVEHPAPLHAHAGLVESTQPNLDSFNQCLEASRIKAQDLRACIKSVENTSARMQIQYDKARLDINNSYTQHVTLLGERRAELFKELEHLYSTRQMNLSQLARNAQDSVDTIFTACDFVDKQRKYANTTELLMHKKPIQKKLIEQMSKNLDVGMQNVSDLEFITNHAASQAAIRSTFGYIRSAPDHQGPTKMAPIARPNSSVSTMNNLNSCLNGINGLSISNSLGLSNGQMPTAVQQHQLTNLATQLGNLQQQQQQQHQHQHHQNQQQNTFSNNGYNAGLATALSALGSQGLGASSMASIMDRGGYTNAQLTSYLAKKYNAHNLGNLAGHGAASVQELNLNTAGYEKWSSGGDSGFFNQDTASVMSGDQMLPADKYSYASFPPRSQIKRQKMIYHCKFGEFGVLEGQFTEPSGVAVNAQNDIIVADTNNHRIQIFDKEGRFKFQFGECGKRDGQLLYPNRVAVVRTSGDIIVTERSPTHQIQIYNQYGQFVRKFGANTLCYPRGVTVDNKGRIIVVECKVMRVIIFDQYGTVLHQFNCPSHLEFPNGVVVNDKQEIFISDNRAHCVKVFSYEGQYLRQIGGEGITNYPIGVGITTQGEILIADNHNNFNLTLFTQDGTLVSAYESKVKHAQCFDVALMDDGSVVLASKDYRLYVYRYLQVPPHI